MTGIRSACFISKRIKSSQPVIGGEYWRTHPVFSSASIKLSSSGSVLPLSVKVKRKVIQIVVEYPTNWSW